MARIKRGVHGLKHRRKVMKLVKGFRAARRRNYRVANEALLKSLAYAFRDRRVRKRDFRSLWISRINAAVRREGLSYSGLHARAEEVGRHPQSQGARRPGHLRPKAFGTLLDLAKQADAKSRLATSSLAAARAQKVYNLLRYEEDRPFCDGSLCRFSSCSDRRRRAPRDAPSPCRRRWLAGSTGSAFDVAPPSAAPPVSPIGIVGGRPVGLRSGLRLCHALAAPRR